MESKLNDDDHIGTVVFCAPCSLKIALSSEAGRGCATENELQPLSKTEASASTMHDRRRCERKQKVNEQLATLDLAAKATDTQSKLTYLMLADSEDRQITLACPHYAPTFQYLTGAAWFQALTAQIYSVFAEQPHPQICLNLYRKTAPYLIATSWYELTQFYATRAPTDEIYTKAESAAMKAAALWKLQLPSLAGSADSANHLMAKYEPAADAAMTAFNAKPPAGCPHP